MLGVNASVYREYGALFTVRRAANAVDRKSGRLNLGDSCMMCSSWTVFIIIGIFTL